MPSAENSHAQSRPLTVTGGGVVSRVGDVRLFIRTEQGPAALLFSHKLACEIGRDLIGLPKHPAALQVPAEPRPGSAKNRLSRSMRLPEYRRILAAALADPAANVAALCRAAGLPIGDFYAWKSHQLLHAKHPVPEILAMRAALAAGRRDPVAKPSGAIL